MNFGPAQRKNLRRFRKNGFITEKSLTDSHALLGSAIGIIDPLRNVLVVVLVFVRRFSGCSPCFKVPVSNGEKRGKAKKKWA